MRKSIFLLLSLCTLLNFSGADVHGRSRDGVAAVFRSQLGVREATGKNDGAAVEMYLRSTGLGKGHAWCGAFVNWVLKECGYTTPKGAAWAPSWFPASRLVYSSGKESRAGPRAGDVFGIWFSNLKRIGHVGFVEKWSGSSVITVEGNTNEAGSREGDGVYRKRRPRRTINRVASWIKD
ncbi:CHAP domain-containing protein [Rufibacter roseus]|uniref:CHAP domain-containing protein n=1 Tax=Rufibacter roseus TaxID=1567108 RepID=A0ABW2DP37_9BACT|nr:CHAP domain-containing protein [Rufibacter roseus]